MYTSNQSYQGSTYKKVNQDENDEPLIQADSNDNYMHVYRPSMGSVSSQNQDNIDKDTFVTTLPEALRDSRQEEGPQDSHVIEHEKQCVEPGERVARLSWAQSMEHHQSYERSSTDRTLPVDGHSSHHNGRHPASRGLSPVEENPQNKPYSEAPTALLYATNPGTHSVLQYTSPTMVHYSTVSGLGTYSPYYVPYVRLPSPSSVAPHEVESSYCALLSNIERQVRAQGQSVLPHSLLPSTVQTHYGTVDGSPLASAGEYSAQNYAAPDGGIYVVGVQPASRSGSRHHSGEESKEKEPIHPYPARERWENHERKALEIDAKNVHNEVKKSSRPSSPRDAQSSSHHVRFKEPLYQSEVVHERVVYPEAPKVAHVHPLEHAGRRSPHRIPATNVHSLYANSITIQTSVQSPPQLVSPPAAYSNMQLQLSPTPQVRPSPTVHTSSSMKIHSDVSRIKETQQTIKSVVTKDMHQMPTVPSSQFYTQPATQKLSAEYPGPSTFPSNFTRGSVIQLASGELKRVEDLCTDDFIQSANVTEGFEFDSSTVVRIEDVPKKAVAIISFSVGEHREQVNVEASLNHPFYVIGHGWSSVKPELTMQRYNLVCHKLAVGDVCVSLTPKGKLTHKKEHTQPVQRTYRSGYLDNKRQRINYWKTPTDTPHPRATDHQKDLDHSSEHRHYTLDNTENLMEHQYRPTINTEKHNRLASELQALDVSSSAIPRISSQVMSTLSSKSINTRPDSKSTSVKGKHTYQMLEEVIEEEEVDTAELVMNQKGTTYGHNTPLQESVEPLAKFTVAR